MDLLGEGLGDGLGDFDGEADELSDGLGLCVAPELLGDVLGESAEVGASDGLGMSDGLAVSDGAAVGLVLDAVNAVAETAAAEPAAHGDPAGIARAASAGAAAYADISNDPLTSATAAHPVRLVRIGTSAPLLESVPSAPAC